MNNFNTLKGYVFINDEIKILALLPKTESDSDNKPMQKLEFMELNDPRLPESVMLLWSAEVSDALQFLTSEFGYVCNFDILDELYKCDYIESTLDTKNNILEIC